MGRNGWAVGALVGVVGIGAVLGGCDQGDARVPEGEPAREGHAEHGGAGGLETRGVVKKVERAEGRVTIDHEAVGDMPAMTMPFYAGDPDMLDGLTPGDAVSFRFRPPSEGARYELTAIEPAPRAE